MFLPENVTAQLDLRILNQSCYTGVILCVCVILCHSVSV